MEEERDDQPFVCIDFLERQAEVMIRWASKCEKQLISEAEIKR